MAVVIKQDIEAISVELANLISAVCRGRPNAAVLAVFAGMIDSIAQMEGVSFGGVLEDITKLRGIIEFVETLH